MKRKVACAIGIFAGIAIAVPLVERDRGPLRPGGELVWTGADGIGRLVGGALFVEDDGGVHAEMKQRLEARRLELEHDRHRIGRVDRGDRGEEALVLVGRVLSGEALERELDVLGREGLAVLKLDVRLEGEGQGLEIGREVPFFREQRRDREVLVDLGQALEDVVVRHFADRGGRRRRRVEARRLENHADRDGVLGGGEARGRDEGDAGGNKKTECAAHGMLRGSKEGAAEHTIAQDEIVKHAKSLLPIGEKGFNASAVPASGAKSGSSAPRNRRWPAGRGARP